MPLPDQTPSPHEFLRGARRETALIRDPGEVPPVVISHEGVDRLVPSRLTRCQETEALTVFGITAEPIWSFWRQIMFSKNGPEHARLRQLVRGGYTQSAVDPERPFIRAEAARLMEQLRLDHEADLVSQFVEPIVAYGICHRAGYDAVDQPRIMAWARLATRIFLGFPPEEEPEVAEGFRQMSEHLDEIIDRRSAAPGDGLIDELISTQAAGKMTREELRAMLGNIVIGGYATTQHALIWLIWYLLHEPESLARVRAEPALIVSALREVLRLEPPIEMTFRTALEDIDVGGCPVAAGETFVVSFLSANRDEQAFDNSEQFDLERQNPRLLSFGAGAHRCLGVSLAIAIVEEAGAALLLGLPGLALVEDSRGWTPAQGYRRTDALLVSY